MKIKYFIVLNVFLSLLCFAQDELPDALYSDEGVWVIKDSGNVYYLGLLLHSKLFAKEYLQPCKLSVLAKGKIVTDKNLFEVVYKKFVPIADTQQVSVLRSEFRKSPVTGIILEFNDEWRKTDSLICESPFIDYASYLWIIKIRVKNDEDVNWLMDREEYIRYLRKYRK
ncbi:MAG: hypothetical protein K8I03_11280 [Ignavibacteria bacterium]|nr:hypothetical protein [Ignavibacteria bacterium]